MAKELAADPTKRDSLYAELARDTIIRNQAEYILTDGDCNFYGIDHYEKANNLFAEDSEVKNILEALLLTTISCAAIAEDLGWAIKTVKLYSRLFFDVRDKHGNMIAPPAVISSMVEEAGNISTAKQTVKRGIILKKKATRGGIAVLLEDVGWTNSACLKEWNSAGRANNSKQEVSKEMFVNILDRVYTNTISGREMVDLYGTFVREKKDKADIDIENKKLDHQAAKVDDGVPILLEILGKAKLTPRLVEKTLTKEDEEEVAIRLAEASKNAKFRESSIADERTTEERIDLVSEAINDQIKSKLNKDKEAN